MSAPTLLRPAAARRRVLAAGGWAAAAVALTVAVVPQAAAAPQTTAPASASASAPASAPAHSPAKADSKPAKAESKPAKPSKPSKPAAAHATKGKNLDQWIKQALDVMDRHNIPGTYDGIHRNIMRESSGDPKAINTWDINAVNGVPSQGLLQVIPPTFDAYHVAGTTKNIVDPVANIVAACNYAADRYGSIDNVWGAY